MFKSGFEKVAATAKIRSALKRAGQHAHRYRREYLMGTSAAAAVKGSMASSRLADAAEGKKKNG